MNTHAQHSRWFCLSGGVLLAAAAMLAAYAPACRRPLTADVYACHDKDVHVNRNAAKGVEEETVAVCKGHKVRWHERGGEDWRIHFDASPFVSGVKDIKKGDDPGPVTRVDQDTAFKYSITVDGKTFDPQIIIMGP